MDHFDGVDKQDVVFMFYNNASAGQRQRYKGKGCDGMALYDSNYTWGALLLRLRIVSVVLMFVSSYVQST